MGDSGGTAVAAQPRLEVVVRTVREVSGTSWPTLTRANYGGWAVTIKVKFRARWLWNAIDKGTDNEEDDMSCQCWRPSSPLSQRSTWSYWGEELW